MKVVGFDGREYSWNLVNHVPLFDDERSRSKLHIKVRGLLTELFPFDRILDEVPLPGSGKRALVADFCVPSRKLIIEAHGKQHYEFNSFHYKNHLEFLHAQSRDRRKKEWCDLNQITLIELSYKESENEWRTKIT